jgi:hypothetical protein
MKHRHGPPIDCDRDVLAGLDPIEERSRVVPEFARSDFGHGDDCSIYATTGWRSSKGSG